MLSRYCCLSWIPIFPTLAAVIFCSSLLRGFGDCISLLSRDFGCCRLLVLRAAGWTSSSWGWKQQLDKVWWASICKCCADTWGTCVLLTVCSTLSQRINHEEPMAHAALNMTQQKLKGRNRIPKQSHHFDLRSLVRCVHAITDCQPSACTGVPVSIHMGVGLDDPYGSLATQNIVWFYTDKCVCALLCA